MAMKSSNTTTRDQSQNENQDTQKPTTTNPTTTTPIPTLANLAQRPIEPEQVKITQLLRDRNFMALAAALMCQQLSYYVTVFHLVAYCLHKGVSQDLAPLTISNIGLFLSIGSFFAQRLMVKLGAKDLNVLCFVVMTMSLGVWPLCTSLLPILAFTAVFGFAYGIQSSIYPSVVADIFGTKQASQITGFMFTGIAFALSGTVLAGVLFDATGSYTVAIEVAAGFCLLATACALATKQTERQKQLHLRRSTKSLLDVMEAGAQAGNMGDTSTSNHTKAAENGKVLTSIRFEFGNKIRQSDS